MASELRGLWGHDSGAVEIGPGTEGVFCFAGGRVVLTDEAVRAIAAVSAMAKAASQAGHKSTWSNGRSQRSSGSWQPAAAIQASSDVVDVTRTRDRATASRPAARGLGRGWLRPRRQRA